MIDYNQARTVMVDNQLRTSNIVDRRLLGVMGRIPRELFLPDQRRELAYIDEAHPLGGGRYLAAPAPFARLVQLAEIAETDRVLDIGCGTGYSTAVIAALAGEVVGVESDKDLAAKARANLAGLGIVNATIVEADLATGPKGRGEFDVVVVEGALATMALLRSRTTMSRRRTATLIRPARSIWVPPTSTVWSRPRFCSMADASHGVTTSRLMGPAPRRSHSPKKPTPKTTARTPNVAMVRRSQTVSRIR